MDHRGCWRRKSQLEFHVLCPRKKKICFNRWTVETDRCCVMEYSFLTLLLQSKRSNTDLCSIGSLLFKMVSWLLKHTSRQNKLTSSVSFFIYIYTLRKLSDAFEKALYLTFRLLFSAKRKIQMMAPASSVSPTARPIDSLSANTETWWTPF